jgi:Na+/melibiose symporter-like transporter
MKTNNGSEKLGLGTKIGFGVGDIYGGGAMVIV